MTMISLFEAYGNVRVVQDALMFSNLYCTHCPPAWCYSGTLPLAGTLCEFGIALSVRFCLCMAAGPTISQANSANGKFVDV